MQGFVHPYTTYTGPCAGVDPGRESSRSEVPSRFSLQVVATGNRAIFVADGVLARHSDWEGCTTDTIGLPNPNRRSVAKTSGFLHPNIYRYTARAFLRERFLALTG